MNSRFRLLAIVGLIGVSTPFAANALATVPFYNVTDLGTLGTGASGASAINNSGQVVGNVGSGNIDYFLPLINDRAFLYDSGITIGIDYHTPAETWAFGANDKGVIAGGAVTIPNVEYDPILYDHGTAKNLGTLGGDSGLALDINGAGQAVGWSTDAQGKDRAFLYSGGMMQSLGTLGGESSEAYRINDEGDAAGWSDTDPNTAYSPHAFKYSAGTLHDLGTLGGYTSHAWGINDGGDVVGDADLAESQDRHAFLYRAGAMTDLGTLGDGNESSAFAINNTGDVVGYAYTTTQLFTNPHAFLYTDGFMWDLNWLIPFNSANWELLSASDINDHGQIVGVGITGGQRHAFLLTPIPVPEPPTATLLALGLFGIGWTARASLAPCNSG